MYQQLLLRFQYPLIKTARPRTSAFFKIVSSITDCVVTLAVFHSNRIRSLTPKQFHQLSTMGCVEFLRGFFDNMRLDKRGANLWANTKYPSQLWFIAHIDNCTWQDFRCQCTEESCVALSPRFPLPLLHIQTLVHTLFLDMKT